MREFEVPEQQLCPTVHNPMVVTSCTLSQALLSCPACVSRPVQPVPAEFTRSSEVTVTTASPRVKRQASSPDSPRHRPAGVLLPIGDNGAAARPFHDRWVVAPVLIYGVLYFKYGLTVQMLL